MSLLAAPGTPCEAGARERLRGHEARLALLLGRRAKSGDLPAVLGGVRLRMLVMRRRLVGGDVPQVPAKRSRLASESLVPLQDSESRYSKQFKNYS